MKRVFAIVCATLLISGCTSYYKVTDPTTGKAYYTTQLQQKNNGAASLKDGRTGSTVNLQNSEIEKITKAQYEAGRTSAPAEPAMPAAK
jgi:uncharacterized protein YceK